MSFVICCACQYFAMMIGDRRAVDYDGKIASENAVKVKRINDNVVTCAGGSETIIHVIWRTVLETELKNAITYPECVSVFKKKCEDIKEEYFKLIKENYMYTSIGLMGFKDGVICLTIFDFLENDITFREIEYATEDDNSIVYIAPGRDRKAQNMFADAFKKCPRFTLENLKSIFYRVAHNCMKEDNSINDSFIMDYIERKDLIERDKVTIEK